MAKRTWIILGATSIIAEHFAHLAAKKGCALCLVGRNKEQLALIAEDIKLRYRIACDCYPLDLMSVPSDLLLILKSISGAQELDLFIAHNEEVLNADLNALIIERMVRINILSTVAIIQQYLELSQKSYHVLYLSSVAACRGRAKNSLYGASKAAVEVYIEGLQHMASLNKTFTIARLGFIDTKRTYGVPGVFYAASPQKCAQACWQALDNKKRLFYYPYFWTFIATLLKSLPFFLSKRLKA